MTVDDTDSVPNGDTVALTLCVLVIEPDSDSVTVADDDAVPDCERVTL